MSDHRYLVSARKYRPRSFAEVVGQDHVTETLKNAIRLDRIAHAYLFSGPRGVGKTTGARILAKAINCETPLDQRIDSAEPCQTCQSCLSFDEGRSLNVIELDAASNNKVDDIRELRETVRIPPQGARRKVYIVDEVHMLSNAAFNALLKTLEEPPPYVLFIFATTEPHKVLPTILSRCQRFDYRRIAVPEIVTRLQHICDTEGIKADEASLMLIARKGDGALRDALSAFDQAVALCGTDIRYDELARAFRVVDVDIFFDVTESAVSNDSARMLGLVDKVVTEGYDLHEFLNGLLGHLRNLYVAHTMKDTRLIEATADVQKRYASAARATSEPNLLRMMTVVADTEESIRSSAQPRLTVELGLLKIVNMASVEDVRTLLEEIRKGDSNRPASSRQPKADARGVENPPAAPKSSPQKSAAIPPMTEPKQASPESVSAADRAAPAPARQQPARQAPPETQESDITVERRPAETEGADAPSLFGPPALKKHPRSSAAPESRTEGSAALATISIPDPGKKSAELREIESIWLAFVRAVKSDRIHVGSLLQHGSPAAFSAHVLTIAIPDDFHRRLLENQETFLREHLGTHSGLRVDQLRFAIRSEAEETDESAPEESFDPHEYMNRKRQESPMIRALFDEFGGELVW